MLYVIFFINFIIKHCVFFKQNQFFKFIIVGGQITVPVSLRVIAMSPYIYK